MLIQINTDNHIEGSERMDSYFTTLLENSLQKYEDRITRLEVHIGDENSHKGGGGDKRCAIEARLSGLKPVAVVNHADTVEKAVAGAADKVKKIVEHTLGKLSAQH